MQKKELNWAHILGLTLLPLGAIAGVIVNYHLFGFSWLDLALFILFYTLGGVAITMGYHRYFAHRTYECNLSVQALLLLFGAAAWQGSVLQWASKHRRHHLHVDTEKDPYNAKRGFFWAHMGWMFYKMEEDYGNLPDLKKSRMVMFQDKYILPLMLTMSFGLPTLIGLAFGRPLAGFVWGGLLRVVTCHHSTFLINSAAHYFGSQPYSDRNTARDSWLLGILAIGEGYHNFHHAFQADYRNGAVWYAWDPSKWAIWSLSKVGLAWRLNKVSDSHLVKTRMDMAYRKVKPIIELQPEPWRERLQKRIEACKHRYELAMTQFYDAKNDYQGCIRSGIASARKEKRLLKAKWKMQLREYRLAAKMARMEYVRTLREIRRTPAS